MKKLLVILVFASLACTASIKTVSNVALPTETRLPDKLLATSTAPPTVLGVPALVIATETVYIRSGPGKGNASVGILKNGDVVHVLNCQQGWASIGPNQWVNSRYLSKVCENE
jgi:uncharacterized protein YgiM (DUF1202 family)